MRPVVLAGALALALVLFASREGGSAVSSKPAKREKPNRDMSLLVPAFRSKVDELLRRMAARGHDAMVWETYRGPARTAQLVAEGTGTALTMHALGLAVDIVERTKLWNASAAFWAALNTEALALGLVRVRHREADGVLRLDKPHVQAVPEAMRAQLAKLTPAQRDVALQRRYGVLA